MERLIQNTDATTRAPKRGRDEAVTGTTDVFAATAAAAAAAFALTVSNSNTDITGLAGMLRYFEYLLGRGSDAAMDIRMTMRARRRWATARAFVQVYRVRPYALFWYADVGKQLCAPGGKWAQHDRAAFLAEFGELSA